MFSVGMKNLAAADGYTSTCWYVVVGESGPLETNMSCIPQTCPGQMAAAMNVWTDVDVGSPTFVTRLTEAMDDLLEQLGWFDGANVYWLHAGQIWALGDVIALVQSLKNVILD